MAIKGLKLKMLEEAYQMIVNEGIDNFTVKNLSKKLNISHNTMYRHFKSKAELIFILLEKKFEELKKSNKAIIERDDLNNIDKYRECFFESLEFSLNNPHIYKLIFATEFKNEDLPNGFTKVYGEYYSQLLKLIEDSIESGEIVKGTKFSVLNTTWALLHGLAMFLVDDVLPCVDDLNSIPKIFDNAKDEESRIPGSENVRDVVGASVDVLLNSIYSTKKAKSKKSKR